MNHSHNTANRKELNKVTTQKSHFAPFPFSAAQMQTFVVVSEIHTKTHLSSTTSPFHPNFWHQDTWTIGEKEKSLFHHHKTTHPHTERFTWLEEQCTNGCKFPTRLKVNSEVFLTQIPFSCWSQAMQCSCATNTNHNHSLWSKNSAHTNITNSL